MKDLPDSPGSEDALVIRTDFSDMDFSDFAESVDADGVFRGFPGD